MASQEVADLLGVTRQRVHQLSERHDFPAPHAILSVGRIWDGAEIRAWAAKHRPSLSEEPEGA
jgi:predicted DNA-binding transcriptional regulator AlpA